MARRLLVATILVGLLAMPAFAQLDRVSGTEKGSLLVFPKIEVWYDVNYCSNGIVWKDTFVDLTNDYPAGVQVQMYFVNGDLCQWVDVGIALTQNQPTYWSAATGSGAVSPWSILDPGCPPGYFDPELGLNVLRGFIVAWAVDASGYQIEWNHLKGDVLGIDYMNGGAYEYNAFAYAASGGGHGNQVGTTAGVLNLDGGTNPAENFEGYDQGFTELLVDFYAAQTAALSGIRTVTVNTDLTFLPMEIDLRQDNDGPTCTKLEFTVWNMNEVKFTNMTRCICCWDQELVTNYDDPNHFLLGNLHTDKGKARVKAVASPQCNDFADPYPVVASSLLGVSIKELTFDGGAFTVYAGTNIHGMGYDPTGFIRADADITPPPSRPVLDGTGTGGAVGNLGR